MKKLGLLVGLCFTIALLLGVSAFAANDDLLASGEIIKVSHMEASAFSEEDKVKGFYNYAEYDAVYNYNANSFGRAVGIVYDEETEEYVKNAWVENLELDFKVKTDKNGRFEINNLPDGEYTWVVKAPGYKGSTFASFPVESTVGASIYRFALSSKRSINSNLKLEKSLKHDHDHDNDKVKEESESNLDGGVTINATHSGWPVIVNFSVMYNNVIYRPKMDTYLYYVVASELYSPTSSLYAGIPADKVLQGFKAQAVTARTYADYITRMYNKHSGYDVCSTTCCQVYNPYYTNQTTISAVDSTTNQMLLVIYNWPTYDYIFVESVFSASCLGYTKNNESVWGGTARSYLRGVPCTYDIRPTLDSGHNIGLCQDGAMGYAKNGWTYIQIVNHFFQGTTVKVCNPQI